MIGRREIVDVMPTLLALAGLAVPDGLDGSPIDEALVCAARRGGEPVRDVPRAHVELDAEGEAEMTARLAALGYLEPPR
jgi:arylsulfatase A-like enzyme